MNSFPIYFNHEYVKREYELRNDLQANILGVLRKKIIEDVQQVIVNGEGNVFILFESELTSHSKFKILQEIYERFPKVVLQNSNDSSFLYDPKKNVDFANIISFYIDILNF